jgi:type II secretory pathway component PulF
MFDLQYILFSIAAIGLPLLVIAASCAVAVRSLEPRSGSRSIDDVYRSLMNFGWVDCCIAVVWGVSGLVLLASATFNGGQRLISVETIASYGMLAGVGVLAAISANVKLKLAKQLKALNTGDPGQAVDKQVGNLKGLVTVAVCLGVIGCCSGIPALLVIELVVALLLTPVWLIRRKQRQESQLLWLLTISVRNNRNLPEEIEEHAARHYGLHANELRQLAANLKSGMSLSQALSVSGATLWWIDIVGVMASIGRFVAGQTSENRFKRHRLLPTWAIAAIANGDETGTLKEELDLLTSQFLNAIRSDEESYGVQRIFSYLLLYGAAIPAVCCFLFLTTTPKLEKIFEGFETEVPAVTDVVFSIGNFIAYYWIPIVVLALWPIAWLLRIGVGRRNGWRDLQQWYLMWMFRRTDTPDILRRLARIVRSGQPILVGLDSLATSHQRRPIRSAMAKISEQVQGGKDCWLATHESLFLSAADLTLVKSAQQNDNLAWALNELAATRERRWAYRVQVAMQIVYPCLVLSVGCVVGFIVVGFFMPVLKLINDLS